VAGAVESIILHLETDASCNFQRTQPREGRTPLLYGGGGVVFRSVTMRPIATYSVRLGFVPSSHHAEYLTFLQGLHLARKHGATGLFARSDLLPLVQQVNGELVDGGEGIPALAKRIEEARAGFVPFKLRWGKSTHRKTRGDGVPTADLLAKRASGVMREGSPLALSRKP
jgi:ribonuclease HI